MYSEVSPRDIILSEMRVGSAYDEKLTDASLILARMQRGQLSAFADAVKMFKWLNEQMTYKQIYNAVYGYVKWGWSPKRKMDVTDDEYASADEWKEFFAWRHLQSKK